VKFFLSKYLFSIYQLYRGNDISREIRHNSSLKPNFGVEQGGQLFSSAGHIAPLLVSRGPHFSQKGKVKAKKVSLRGLDVARGPYVAPSWCRELCSWKKWKKII